MNMTCKHPIPMIRNTKNDNRSHISYKLFRPLYSCNLELFCNVQDHFEWTILKEKMLMPSIVHWLHIFFWKQDRSRVAIYVVMLNILICIYKLDSNQPPGWVRLHMVKWLYFYTHQLYYVLILVKANQPSWSLSLLFSPTVYSDTLVGKFVFAFHSSVASSNSTSCS